MEYTIQGTDPQKSERLHVAMNNELAQLRQSGFLDVRPECYERLQHISPATMDRLRARAHVEQKNWSVVRRAVGYERYDTPEQLYLLNRLYSVLRLYTNFFIPTMKLMRKERQGSKVKKVYDKPQTPYARVLASPEVSDEDKAELHATYQALDIVQLRRQIDQLLDQLLSQPADESDVTIGQTGALETS